MAQEFEEVQEDEFEQSSGGWWIRLIGVVVYMAIIVAYAVQTLELVNWLFPASNWFMMIVTVFVCDGCAIGYAMAEMFYRFKLRKTKNLVFGMWIITFVLSTAATVIQMYLSSTNNIPHRIDPTIIQVAYGLIIIAFVVNILAITVMIRMEHAAGKPVHRYLDDGKPRGKGKAIAFLPQKHETPPTLPQQTSTPVQPVTQAAQPMTEQTFTLAQVEEMMKQALATQQQSSSPLTQPILNTAMANQDGTTNGNGH